MRPASALAAAVAVVAVALGLLWPEAAERGRVVRWIDGGGRSVMVLDDDPDTTIIWMLDGFAEAASRGGVRTAARRPAKPGPISCPLALEAAAADEAVDASCATSS